MPAVDRGVDEDDDRDQGGRQQRRPRGAEAEEAGAEEDGAATQAGAVSGRVKTSNDWMTLFLGSGSGRGLNSPSLYSKLDIGKKIPPSADMYDRPGSYSASASSSSSRYTTSYGSRYYSSSTAGYLSGTGAGGTSYRNFSSLIRSPASYSSPYGSRRRYGRRRQEEEEEGDTKEESHTARRETDTADKDGAEGASQDSSNNNDSAVAGGKKSKKKRKSAPSTVINGNVIRITKKKSDNNNGSSESSEEDDSDEESQTEEEASPPPPPPKSPTPPPPPPPPPEDPLEVEERMLKAQLALSFTLTMTDEENIRQRMMEIKKAKIKRSSQEIERGLIEKFEKESDQLTEPTRAKEEEEKILIARLSAETLREVEQKDIQVRLQEIFRDRKSALEVTLRHMETHYQHLLQENSTETRELDGSIREKQAQVDRIQEEMLGLTVRKELLASGMEKVAHRHQEQLEQVGCQQRELDTKISQYAVLAPPPCARRGGCGAAAGGGGARGEEIRELEQELECPVCMDISRPPIYQCEEGHIICSSCKPLLTNCPHCSKKYSNPVIRCRFAEKLAERYLKMVEVTKEEEEEGGRGGGGEGDCCKDLQSKTDNPSLGDLEGLDFLQ